MHIKVVPRATFENVRAVLAAAPIYEIQDSRLVALILDSLNMIDGTIALLATIDDTPAIDRLSQWHHIARWTEDQRGKARGVLHNLQAAEVV